jgi:hypothetical protein
MNFTEKDLEKLIDKKLNRKMNKSLLNLETISLLDKEKDEYNEINAEDILKDIEALLSVWQHKDHPYYKSLNHIKEKYTPGSEIYNHLKKIKSIDPDNHRPDADFGTKDEIENFIQENRSRGTTIDEVMSAISLGEAI